MSSLNYRKTGFAWDPLPGVSLDLLLLSGLLGQRVLLACQSPPLLRVHPLSPAWPAVLWLWLRLAAGEQSWGTLCVYL